MLRRIIPALTLITAILCTACGTARGFSAGKLGPVTGEKREIDDAYIREKLARRPQASVPLRVGVYFIPPRPDYDHEYETPVEAAWRVDGDDRDALLNIGEELRKAGVVSQFFLMSDAVLELSMQTNLQRESDDLLALRRMAALHNADAVLVIGGRSEVRERANLLSALYLTVAGMFVIPGSERDASFTWRGTLWDVRNEYLYAVAEHEASAANIRPLALTNEEELIEEAKDAAMKKFSAELQAQISRLK